MLGKKYIVGISGGSCSGKSTMATMLANSLGERFKIKLFHLDDYYQWDKMKTIAPITGIEYTEHNHPDGVNMDALYKDFMAAIDDTSNDIILVEGLFALYFAQLRKEYDLKIFIDLKSDERLYRRIKRNMVHSPMEEIAVRYLDTVRYRYDEFVEPTRWHADLVVNGTLDANQGAGIAAMYIEAQVQG